MNVHPGLLMVITGFMAKDNMPSQEKQIPSDGGIWRGLFNAGSDGDQDRVAQHLGNRGDLSCAHPEFLCTLQVACVLAGQDKVARYLLDSGANPTNRPPR
jgi:hypothetical protein